MDSLTKGTRVRFTVDNLGAIDPDNPYGFHPEVKAMAGEIGTVKGPHPTVEGWMIIEIEWLAAGTLQTETYEIPVAPAHVEPVERFTAEDKAALQKQSDILNGFAADALRKLA